MLALPVHPRLARLIVAARESGRARDGATIAALLSEKDIRLRRASQKPGSLRSEPPGSGAGSDILTRLDLLAEAERAHFAPTLRNRGIDPFAARQVARLRDDLMSRDRTQRTEQPHGETDDDDLLRWILLAYPDRVVKRRGLKGTGVMVGGRGVRLAPDSVVRDADLFVALDARDFRRPGVLEARVDLASAVQLEWLEEFFPDHIRREQSTRYDEPRRRVLAANQLWYHDLLLREDIAQAAPQNLGGSHLADALREQAADLFLKNPAAELWLARVEFVRRVIPELDWPDFDDKVFSELLEAVCRENRGSMRSSGSISFRSSRPG